MASPKSRSEQTPHDQVVGRSLAVSADPRPIASTAPALCDPTNPVCGFINTGSMVRGISLLGANQDLNAWAIGGRWIGVQADGLGHSSFWTGRPGEEAQISNFKVDNKLSVMRKMWLSINLISVDPIGGPSPNAQRRVND